MIFRLIIQTGFWLASIAALLFIPAGTLDWPGAWIVLAEMAVLALGLGLWLANHDPELLKERLSALVQHDQKAWDRVLMGAVVLLSSGWFVFMGLDAGGNGTVQVSGRTQALGAVGIALCIYMTFLTLRENTYAAPVVKVQTGRGQTVITTGPYRLIRHPMYAAAALYCLSVPLVLGSLWGLALAPVIIALLAGRAVMEERTLRAELAGYADYASRVRYRLIPFVW